MSEKQQQPVIRVNADDAGLHPDIDEGIAQCIEAGAISSISVMAISQRINWNRIQEFNKVGVETGVHLCWVEEPWLSNGNAMNRNGLFLKTLLQGKGFLKQLKAEGQRQIETFLERGLAISHLDSHQHVHHFPGIWQITEELAHEYQVPYIRVTKVSNKHLQRAGLGGAALQYWASKIETDITHYNCIGLRESGANTLAVLRSELSFADGEDLELIVHPGVATAELLASYTHWNYNWDAEREMLTDPKFLQVLQEFGYNLA